MPADREAEPESESDEPKSDKLPPSSWSTGDFDELMAYARDNLKGIERRTVELLCENQGERKLSDLAADQGIDWSAPYDNAWNSTRTRINKKLKTAGLCWRLSRSDNAARLRCLDRK